MKYVQGIPEKFFENIQQFLKTFRKCVRVLAYLPTMAENPG